MGTYADHGLYRRRILMAGIVEVSRDAGEAGLDRLSRQEAAHAENERSEFR